ncbi:hypothetical protein CBR_g46421 [Chara braunii]|uniref:Reverse transcriptase domain-containing protein n=1 Tax=Chara braunii TaxID=69332 RepID=A0A388M0N3_CHABU|nr:hypothetical protein CBR_g46421 [Chara braunii]|eukprot:GBG88052.1 hypothetical protein CBR_g46421 [Chara braunii]
MADEGIRDTRVPAGGQRQRTDDEERDDIQDALDEEEGREGGAREGGVGDEADEAVGEPDLPGEEVVMTSRGVGRVGPTPRAPRPELERARREKRTVGQADVKVRDTGWEKRARQTTIDEMYAKEKLAKFTDAWLQWIYVKGLPFNAFRGPEFQRVRQTAERVPRSVQFRFPSFRVTAGAGIPSQKVKVVTMVSKVRVAFRHSGATILSDGRKSRSGKPLVNFLAGGANGALLYATVARDGSDRDTADIVYRRRDALESWRAYCTGMLGHEGQGATVCGRGEGGPGGDGDTAGVGGDDGPDGDYDNDHGPEDDAYRLALVLRDPTVPPLRPVDTAHTFFDVDALAQALTDDPFAHMSRKSGKRRALGRVYSPPSFVVESPYWSGSSLIGVRGRESRAGEVGSGRRSDGGRDSAGSMPPPPARTSEVGVNVGDQTAAPGVAHSGGSPPTVRGGVGGGWSAVRRVGDRLRANYDVGRGVFTGRTPVQTQAAEGGSGRPSLEMAGRMLGLSRVETRRSLVLEAAGTSTDMLRGEQFTSGEEGLFMHPGRRQQCDLSEVEARLAAGVAAGQAALDAIQRERETGIVARAAEDEDADTESETIETTARRHRAQVAAGAAAAQAAYLSGARGTGAGGRGGRRGGLHGRPLDGRRRKNLEEALRRPGLRYTDGERGKLYIINDIKRKMDGYIGMSLKLVMEGARYDLQHAVVRCGDKLVKQVFGIPMGKSTSPILASITCAMPELRFIQELGSHRRLIGGWRVIDDITIIAGIPGNTYNGDYPNNLFDAFEEVYDRNLEIIRKDGCGLT